MPSRDYEKLLMRQYDKIENITKVTEKELARRYKAAYQSAIVKISALYAKRGDEPTLEEAKRYNKLANLLNALAAEYKTLTKQAISKTENNSIKTFTEAVYRTQWAVDQSTGIALSFPVLPVDAIRASVYSDASGLTFIQTLKKNGAAQIVKLSQTITQGLALGESYPKMARRVKDSFQSGYSDAIRVVRTEAGRNMNDGHLKTYADAEAAGVEMTKKWVATLDGRTRDSHGHLDGKAADENGLFWIGSDSAPAPGLFSQAKNVINCRCRVVEEITGLEPQLRRIRDEGLVPYVTFDDWAASKGYSNGRWPVAKKV